jgi:hypothetical protein
MTADKSKSSAALAERVAVVERTATDFERWQKDQNGTLLRVEEKVSGLAAKIARTAFDLNVMVAALDSKWSRARLVDRFLLILILLLTGKEIVARDLLPWIRAALGGGLP